MKRVKAGVIGVGHMGQYHAGAYMELPYVELVGVADVNEERLEMVTKRYDVKGFTDFHDLLPLVDVVTVAVPTQLHTPVGREVLNAGVHVLMEKPIARTMEEAVELTELAREKGLTLHLGHVERFNGAVQELMKIVTEPLLVESRRLGPFVERVADDGVVLDLMIHDIDIVLRLVNSKVKSINASGTSVFTNKGDAAVVTLSFEDGCVASITASRLTQNKIRTMAVSEKDFYVFLNFTEQDLHIHREAFSEAIRTPKELRYRQSSLIEQVFVHKENPLKQELAHFIEAAMSEDGPSVPTELDLESLRIALTVEDMLKDQGVIE